MASNNKVVVFEVYCLTSSMTDVCEYDTLEQAEQIAMDWSKSSKCPVVVDRIEKEIIKTYTNGKEVI